MIGCKPLNGALCENGRGQHAAQKSVQWRCSDFLGACCLLGTRWWLVNSNLLQTHRAAFNPAKQLKAES